MTATRSSGRQTFKDLAAEVDGDNPNFAKLVDHYKQEAIAEHVVEGLAALRSMRAVTQTAIAAELAIAQSNVSRIEHQEDLLLSTVRAYIESLGGRLELNVVFDDVEDPGNEVRVKLAV